MALTCKGPNRCQLDPKCAEQSYLHVGGYKSHRRSYSAPLSEQKMNMKPIWMQAERLRDQAAVLGHQFTMGWAFQCREEWEAQRALQKPCLASGLSIGPSLDCCSARDGLRALL